MFRGVDANGRAGGTELVYQKRPIGEYGRVHLTVHHRAPYPMRPIRNTHRQRMRWGNVQVLSELAHRLSPRPANARRGVSDDVIVGLVQARPSAASRHAQQFDRAMSTNPDIHVPMMRAF